MGWWQGAASTEIRDPYKYIQAMCARAKPEMPDNPSLAQEIAAVGYGRAIDLDTGEIFEPDPLPLPVPRGGHPMHAPKRATRQLGWVGHADGTATQTWATDKPNERIQTMSFIPYPFLKVNNVDQGRDHLLKLWQKLDAEIDTIRSSDPQLIEYNKARASTLAEVIAQLMSPFYASTEDVLRESMNRWTARQNGAGHDTPGLGEELWDPLARQENVTVVKTTGGSSRPSRSGGAPPAPPKPKAKLDEQKVTFIKHSLANGTMTPEVLAGMFACTVDDIKAANDS